MSAEPGSVLSEPNTRPVRVIGSWEPGAINPFVTLMVQAVSAAGEIIYQRYEFLLSISGWPDVWHFNWPEAAYRSKSALICGLKCAKLILQIDLARLRGTHILWMVHNLEPHRLRHRRIEAWFWSAFRKRVDAYVHLSQAGGDWFRRVYDCRATQVHYHLRHPAFPATSDPVRESTRRGDFGQAAIRLLMFGSIRPYKGYADAIAAFRVMRGGRHSELHVVGEPSAEGVRSQVMAAAGSDPRVVLLLERLSDDDLEACIGKSDGVVIPQTGFLNSGSLMLAISRHRPVLVRSTPVTEELRREIGPDWVYLFDGELNPQVLEGFVSAIRSRPHGVSQPDLDRYQWAVVGHELATAYRTLAFVGAG